MKRTAELFLLFTVLALGTWQIPWLCNFISTDSTRVPFTLYSPLAGDFLSINTEGNTLTRVDQKGNIYTEAEADSLLPFFYMRQLVADGRFPDSIMGREVTPHEVQRNGFIERFNPRDINANNIKLYPLLESMPKRVELEMPDDVMRITDHGLEFISIAENSINSAKSDLFTKALTDKGFTFPAVRISGNPTTRKEYDEGYLLVDAEGRLFNLKRCAGRPYVRSVAVPEGLEIDQIFIQEPTNKKIRGFITDKKHRMYVLNADYEILETGIGSFDPSNDQMLIIGNLIDWTVAVTTDKAVTYYALSADDYSLITSFVRPIEKSSVPGLHFTSNKDKYVYPRF